MGKNDGVQNLKILPKRVFTLEEVKPGEKLCEVCVILKDIPGALAKALKVLADARVNIKTGSSFHLPDYPKATIWSSFLDVSKATCSIRGLERELRKLDTTVDVKFEELKLTSFETIHFPLMHAKTRAVIVPVGMFWALWDGFERILEPSGLAAVLYSAGKKTGEHVTMAVRDMYSVRGMNLISAVGQAVKATGWGIVEVRGFNPKKPGRETVIIKDCIEAAAWRQKPYKVCHWTRGYTAGVFSVVYGRQMEAIEAKCMATGDKYCEFKLQTKI